MAITNSVCCKCSHNRVCGKKEKVQKTEEFIQVTVSKLVEVEHSIIIENNLRGWGKSKLVDELGIKFPTVCNTFDEVRRGED